MRKDACGESGERKKGRECKRDASRERGVPVNGDDCGCGNGHGCGWRHRRGKEREVIVLANTHTHRRRVSIECLTTPF